MSKFKDFIHRVANDLDRVHVRAAFMDVEHRIAHLFHHHGEHLPASGKAREEQPGSGQENGGPEAEQ